MIAPSQIRAARALLGINQQELAKRSSVGVATIRRIEVSKNYPTSSTRTLWKIRAALEDAGIRFLDETENLGPGVRIRYSTKNRNLNSDR